MVLLGCLITGFSVRYQERVNPKKEPLISVPEIYFPEVNQNELVAEITGLQQSQEKISHADLSARLADIEMDGALLADVDGNLILSPQIKDFFEFLFVAVGDVDAELIVAFIHYYADENLPVTAAKQVKQVLSDYLIYKERAQQYLQTETPPTGATPVEAMAQAYQYLASLRREQLGSAVATAIFAEEEAYSDYTLARMKLMGSPSLTDEDKKQQLTILVNNLPPELAQIERRKQERSNTAKTTMAILQSGQSLPEKRQQLERIYSAERVDIILDQQRQEAAWQQRYEHYRRERQGLQTSAGLSDMDKQAAIIRLRGHYFATPQEQSKASVYDAMFEQSVGSQ
ncbi:hypothetical protein R50073_43300 [Maricurvus nonylphenolicus]